MYTNVNLAAPIGVLAFLLAGFLLLIAGVALIYSLLTRKFGLARMALVAFAIVAAVYCASLLLFSFSSKEIVLNRGMEKHFCEIDCHLAYSITNVQEAKEVGDGPNRITAHGVFRIVTVQTRFDPTTIASNRGDRLLYPNSRVLVVSGEDGPTYSPATVAQAALGSAQESTPITTPLRPGESYTTTFVFDLPANIRNPTLLIHEGEAITHFVIGHENSPLHKKTRFQI